MVKLAWDDIGTIGIEPVDQDHQQMTLMVNTLFEAITANDITRARGLAALLAERFETHCLREGRLFVPEGIDVRHALITRQMAELVESLAEDVKDTETSGAIFRLQTVSDSLLEEIADDGVLVKTMCGQALDLAERRRYLRFRVALAVAARAAAGEDVSPVTLINISRGGCLFANTPDSTNTGADAADSTEIGQEVVMEVLGQLFPGILVASDEQGQHVRFHDHVESDHMAKILLRGVIEPAAEAKEDGSG